jgi:heparanase
MPGSSIIRFSLRNICRLHRYLTSVEWRRLPPLLTHPKIVILELLLLGLWLLTGHGDDSESMTLVWTDKPVEISDAFFGVAIDAAMLTDGEWWSNSDSPPRPLDFNNPQLIRWTRLLAPDWVRLGGTEADKLWLTQAAEVTPNAPELSRNKLNQFLNFVSRIKARPFISISTGPLTRSNGQWQPEQLQRLLQWLPQDFNGALEFGNEPGAHWLIFGRTHQIAFEQLADEYQQARRLTHAHNIKLAGPANAFWPEIGEPLKQLFGSSKDFLTAHANPDIFTWHYYPTQSSRCGVKTEGASWDGLLSIETQREFEKRSIIIQRWLKQYAPQSHQWLGETGPAQCGGKAMLTDRFGSSLWWLSQLGSAAKYGNETVIRQSLVGGDYALLGYRQGYSPNPDFWASLLWQQNMGAVAFPMAETDGGLRAFAHCHPNRNAVMSVLLVNLNNHNVRITLPQMQSGRFLDVTSYQLSSRYTLINGVIAASLSWEEASLPWIQADQWRDMPAYSYRWVQVDGAEQCLTDEKQG